MSKWNNKDIISLYFRDIFIDKVYYGTHLVLEAIRSCFGRGYWINNAPWLNYDGWRNN